MIKEGKEWGTHIRPAGSKHSRQCYTASRVETTFPDTLTGMLRKECRARRCKLNWSLTHLEKLCGIKGHHIGEWENGKLDMRLSSVQRILTAVGLKVTLEEVGPEWP